MSLPVVFRLAAYDDIDAVHTSYESLRPGLGDDFVAEVGATRARIGQNPQLYGVIGRGVRAAKVRRFPYVVYYLVEPNRVVIVAILHARRSSRAWQRRI
ncbi:MAG TPA: type II toxin-antitoxin system RelE/ParE family toxin [Gemmataceae bacterium]|nr:type II toxin-antitoxin system RelE/ParE family toxin [Gemmataceae bacterium]